MQNIIKRRFRARNLITIFGLVVVLMLLDAQKISAEEKSETSYLIKVNRYYNTITIYGMDEDGIYSEPIKAMVCSVGYKGTETVTGAFQTKAKYRWKLLMGDVWGQYSTRIVGGILFHSVYYYQYGNPATLATKEYNKLGNAASHGCIRLTVEDAKWIYDNCAVGTTVVIYDDKEIPGPLGKPKAIKLPTNVRWDPTDPSSDNPHKDKTPVISGIKNKSISWGNDIDLLKGVKAKSSVGLDITEQLIVDGDIDVYSAGEYDITYSVIDELNRSTEKIITVTVKESIEKLVFQGVGKRYIREDVIVNEEYALSGVDVYCSDTKLSKDTIEVSFDNIDEDTYFITYYASVDDKLSTTKYVTFYVDKKAPKFKGISDRILEFGQVPDRALALKEVAVTDNFADLEQDDIIVYIDKNIDGSFLITYKAEDDVGNVVLETAKFYYKRLPEDV